jgi:hypothetical protein
MGEGRGEVRTLRPDGILGRFSEDVGLMFPYLSNAILDVVERSSQVDFLHKAL